MNVRSIVEKRFDLCAYLATYQIDILSVTETFLDHSINDASIAPFGYGIYRHDQNRHGGGVLILVRSTFTVIRRNDLDSSSEILWIELVSKNQCPLLFGVIYQPPSASRSVLDQLYGLLCTLTSCRCNIVLCGDFDISNVTGFAKRGLLRAFINIEKSRFEILITVYLDNAWCLVTNFSTNL